MLRRASIIIINVIKKRLPYKNNNLEFKLQDYFRVYIVEYRWCIVIQQIPATPGSVRYTISRLVLYHQTHTGATFHIVVEPTRLELSASPLLQQQKALQNANSKHATLLSIKMP